MNWLHLSNIFFIYILINGVDCGQTTVSSHKEVGAPFETTEINEFPWNVWMNEDKEPMDEETIRMGILISDRHIITKWRYDYFDIP